MQQLLFANLRLNQPSSTDSLRSSHSSDSSTPLHTSATSTCQTSDDTTSRPLRFEGTDFPGIVPLVTGFGLIGIVRFLLGYYLIVITQHRQVAQIGEHKIFMVEDTKIIYIPNQDNTLTGPDDCDFNKESTFIESGNPPNSPEISQSFLSSVFLKNKKTTPEELRYVKLFHGVELNSNFYFSYTYDLTNTLQINLEPEEFCVTALRSIPNSRFIWNWSLIPPKFRQNNTPLEPLNSSSDWFIPIIHGFIDQVLIASCGVTISIMLLARRSRLYAGTRFLKRGINLTGDVANEVETEQIVCDTNESILIKTRCSSYTQLRGSIPLFWNQESGKLAVGKPPIEINRNDPYCEAFGMHFSNLLERFGSPIIVLNLIKQKEKRLFEGILTDGLIKSLQYLDLFMPKLGPPSRTGGVFLKEDKGSPILYIGFDMARAQRSPTDNVLDCIKPIAEACLKKTGVFFSMGRAQLPLHIDGIGKLLIQRTREHLGSDLCPRQHGLVRTNCIDCLDRTNTAQFVIGHVALAYQLRALRLLPASQLSFVSALSRILQNLYEDHGNTLAMQYGGSYLVHNIETYKKTRRLRSQSRDFVQTLSRYFSNNFADFEKQVAINLFLRVFRPAVWPGSTFDDRLDTSIDSLSEVDSEALSSAFTVISSNMSWELGYEQHLHWLEAWFRLPVQRRQLTCWFPQRHISSQRRRLRRWMIDEEEDCHVGTARISDKEDLIERTFAVQYLSPNNLCCNWFGELYQPTRWSHFCNLSVFRLPLIQPKMKPNLSGFGSISLNKTILTPRTLFFSYSQFDDDFHPPIQPTPDVFLNELKTSEFILNEESCVCNEVSSIRGNLKESLDIVESNSSESDTQSFMNNFVVVSNSDIVDACYFSTASSKLEQKSICPEVGSISKDISFECPNKLTFTEHEYLTPNRTPLDQPVLSDIIKEDRIDINSYKVNAVHTMNSLSSNHNELIIQALPSDVILSKHSNGPYSVSYVNSKNDCESYALIRLSAPSPQDIKTYEDYTEYHRIFSEELDKIHHFDVNLKSLNSYSDAVNISRTGVCSISPRSMDMYMKAFNYSKNC